MTEVARHDCNFKKYTLYYGENVSKKDDCLHYQNNVMEYENVTDEPQKAASWIFYCRFTNLLLAKEMCHFCWQIFDN